MEFKYADNTNIEEIKLVFQKHRRDIAVYNLITDE